MLLLAVPGCRAWLAARRAWHVSLAHTRPAAITMCDDADEPSSDEQLGLHASLKRAAAHKLGTNIEEAMRPEDLAWYRAGANSMAAALQEAKEQLAERKAVIGEEAAVAELEANARAGALEHPLLKARPKLWLLDRDGCINEDVGAPGVTRADDLRLIPGSAGAVRRLRLAGKVAIITNQSARGKGLLSAEGLDAIHEALRHQLATTARGGRVGAEQWDAMYVCEDAEASHRKKPAPGMVLEAVREFGCTPSEAVMIGDSWSDVVAAQRAGCVGVLLATGHGAGLGALLREHGVRLPITLTVDGAAEAAATEFVALQRSLARPQGGSTSAADAVQGWIATRSDQEAALIWEALQNDVRVFADLSQAVDELVDVASAL